MARTYYYVRELDHGAYSERDFIVHLNGEDKVTMKALYELSLVPLDVCYVVHNAELLREDVLLQWLSDRVQPERLVLFYSMTEPAESIRKAFSSLGGYKIPKNTCLFVDPYVEHLLGLKRRAAIYYAAPSEKFSAVLEELRTGVDSINIISRAMRRNIDLRDIYAELTCARPQVKLLKTWIRFYGSEECKRRVQLLDWASKIGYRDGILEYIAATW